MVVAVVARVVTIIVIILVVVVREINQLKHLLWSFPIQLFQPGCLDTHFIYG